MADDIDIEQLVAELRRGPIDLSRLVTHVLVRHPPRVWVSARSAEAWRRRNPETWAQLLAWLKHEAVSVEIV